MTPRKLQEKKNFLKAFEISIRWWITQPIPLRSPHIWQASSTKWWWSTARRQVKFSRLWWTETKSTCGDARVTVVWLTAELQSLSTSASSWPIPLSQGLGVSALKRWTRLLIGSNVLAARGLLDCRAQLQVDCANLFLINVSFHGNRSLLSSMHVPVSVKLALLKAVDVFGPENGVKACQAAHDATMKRIKAWGTLKAHVDQCERGKKMGDSVIWVLLSLLGAYQRLRVAGHKRFRGLGALLESTVGAKWLGRRRLEINVGIEAHGAGNDRCDTYLWFALKLLCIC